MLYRKIIAVVVTLALALGIAGTALADTSPNGHGQPGAPGTTCVSTTAALVARPRQQPDRRLSIRYCLLPGFPTSPVIHGGTRQR
jgi:hypothetical protein